MIKGRTPKGSVLTCGSQGYSEVEIHCELVKTLVEEKTDHTVRHIENLGSSLAGFQALQTGDLDMFVTFTGTLFLGPMEQQLKPGLSTQEEVWEYVHEEALKRWNIWAFKAFGYNNVYAVALPAEVAKRLDLTKVSDLKPYADQWSLGMDQSFMDYPGQGYKEFAEVYDMEFQQAIPMNYGVMYRAAAEKEVDAIVAYSTDGRIPQLDLVVLEDDKQFNPPYYGMIAANNETLQKYPEVKSLVELLEGTIDTPTMQELNKRAAVDDVPPQRIAREYLQELGLL